ncbi:acetolactate synthase I/II/III large subunit [Agaricicola taiwanensis]|uniref:Acetolactate synthase I/II/III large subunit n=1 Tax=Agaricicola taiwanensis TaxID=591372 RepID=A0A8J2VJU2_9RHOB|nr:thiamine pyrophosphate-binding protein [Agaricicola taiwanensis]GGE32813.1 acetolactate synthase I/II/III large subunit [Agaricicola taiwanensis]
MSGSKIYKLLAEAFFLEGVDTHFTLMGDGNMHWVSTLAGYQGVRTIYVRHEHCACAAASAYATATGKVGVASVTCGPGLTQLSTALATAVRARIPLVVFAGESPLNMSWYNQEIDQGPIVTATGAHYIQAHSLPRMLEYVRNAFFIARMEQRPVVLGVPYDLQKQLLEPSKPYVPSTEFIPDTGRMVPNPAFVERAADRVAQAKRIIVIAGRGAKKAGAQEACRKLAGMVDALLATTLPVRGLFDEDEFSLGVAGGFSSEVAREKFDECDLVISVGASMTHHTVDGGKLFPNADVIQIDCDPAGIRQGLKVADLYVRADAKAGVEALISAVEARKGTREASWRTPELARRIIEEPSDSESFPEQKGMLDPRDAIAALNRVIPKDWEIVNSSGHCSFYPAQMRGRSAERFLVIREFGAIGNGVSYAIGMAAAKPEKTIVLIDGDGSFYMHVQELETIRRHNLRILICVLNDGAFGAEIHKLRSDGIDDSGSTFGRGDLGKLAQGFGLRGSTITSPDQFAERLEGFKGGAGSEIWDIHVSDLVMSPVMRRAVKKKMAPAK